MTIDANGRRGTGWCHFDLLDRSRLGAVLGCFVVFDTIIVNHFNVVVFVIISVGYWFDNEMW